MCTFLIKTGLIQYIRSYSSASALSLCYTTVVFSDSLSQLWEIRSALQNDLWYHPFFLAAIHCFFLLLLNSAITICYRIPCSGRSCCNLTTEHRANVLAVFMATTTFMLVILLSPPYGNLPCSSLLSSLQLLLCFIQSILMLCYVLLVEPDTTTTMNRGTTLVKENETPDTSPTSNVSSTAQQGMLAPDAISLQGTDLDSGSQIKKQNETSATEAEPLVQWLMVFVMFWYCAALQSSSFWSTSYTSRRTSHSKSQVYDLLSSPISPSYMLHNTYSEHLDLIALISSASNAFFTFGYDLFYSPNPWIFRYNQYYNPYNQIISV